MNAMLFAVSALALTNTVFRVPVQGDRARAFTTGEGKDVVAVEAVNATDRSMGFYWDCQGEGLKIGDSGSDCSFLLDGGGVTGGAVVSNIVFNRVGFHLGTGYGARRNRAVLKGGAALYDGVSVNNAGNDIGRGTGSGENRLEILGGTGFVTRYVRAFPGRVGADFSERNTVVVDGCGIPGSARFETSRESIVIGSDSAKGNRIEIVNGGELVGPSVVVGQNASDNVLLVSGEGSLVQGSDGDSVLKVGSYRGGLASVCNNRLVVEKGARVVGFQKWAANVGTLETDEPLCTAVGNGIEVREGGRVELGQPLQLGRGGGTETLVSGNFITVTGKGSLFTTSENRPTEIGQAFRRRGEGGATVSENGLTVSDGARYETSDLRLSVGSSEVQPRSSCANFVRVTTGAFLRTTGEVVTGNQADLKRTEEEAVSCDNTIRVDRGGVLEARRFRCLSDNGNEIVFSDGGVLQTPEEFPRIETNGLIRLDSGVLSFRRDGCSPHTWENDKSKRSWAALTVTGRNAFRVAACRTDGTSYDFHDDAENPRHFSRLEMVDGETAWCGGESDRLIVGPTGSMLVSNTVARLEVPFVLNGPLVVVDATLIFAKGAKLDAPVKLIRGRLEGDWEKGQNFREEN